MTKPESPARPPSRWRRWLGWIAPIGLALVVVCSGCFMLFAFALTAQGELTASVAGSDWRIWQIQQQGTSGIGVSQSSAFTSRSGQTCRYVRVWLMTWRPSLLIEANSYEDCDISRVWRAPVARAHRLAIIMSTGVR